MPILLTREQKREVAVIFEAVHVAVLGMTSKRPPKTPYVSLGAQACHQLANLLDEFANGEDPYASVDLRPGLNFMAAEDVSLDDLEEEDEDGDVPPDTPATTAPLNWPSTER